MPTENALKKSLEATFVNANRQTHSADENDQINACCRSLHKCEAYKRIEFNQTNVSFGNFRHCDCIHSFQICLDDLNSTISNEVEFLHSINTIKCYTDSYPIIQCIKWVSYPEWKAPFLKFGNQTEREFVLKRCSKYELDNSRPKQLQLRDLSFNHHEMSANNITNMPQDAIHIHNKSEFVLVNWKSLNY